MRVGWGTQKSLSYDVIPNSGWMLFYLLFAFVRCFLFFSTVTTALIVIHNFVNLFYPVKTELCEFYGMGWELDIPQSEIQTSEICHMLLLT